MGTIIGDDIGTTIHPGVQEVLEQLALHDEDAGLPGLPQGL